jgi:hypothetical protein
MAESLTLTTPIAKPSTTAFHVSSLFLDVDGLRIVVTLVGDTGETLSKQYDSFTTPTGATLLHSLNIGNFSVNSLMKAVYTRLGLDGVIVGTVNGVPV